MRGRFWLGTEDKGVFSSVDGGRRWEPHGQDWDIPTVYAIAVHPEKQGWIYIGTWGGGVYVSTDNGVAVEAELPGPDGSGGPCDFWSSPPTPASCSRGR